MTLRHTFIVSGKLLKVLIVLYCFIALLKNSQYFFLRRTGRAGKKGFAVSFFVPEKNGRMARDIIEILNRTSQNVPSELQASAMASRGGGGRGRGRGGRRY
jgi:hypothetical protein